MTTFLCNPTSQLLAGETPVAGSRVERVSVKVNDGWSVTARVQGELDIYQARYSPFNVNWSDGLGNSRSTPALIWPERGYTDSKSTTGPDVTTLGLRCATSNRMRIKNQHFDSFLASSSGAIISALAARAGVTITGITGPLDFYVIEEDIKRAKLEDALKRFLNVAAADYEVTPAGVVACRPWEAEEVDLEFDWSVRKHQLDTRNWFTDFRGGKRSSQNYEAEQVYVFDTPGFENQALSPFLTSPSCANESIAGAGNIAAVTFYNADDEWVVHYDFTLGGRPEPAGPQGTGQCTYLVAEVLPATVGSQTRAQIRVNGIPPESLPPGIDPEFLYPAPETSLGEWPAEADFIDQLFPSQSYFLSRKPHLKNRMNAPADRLQLIGPLQAGPTVKLFARHEYKSREFKVVGIEWNLIGNQTTIDLVRQVSEI